jgi:predicted ATPase/DNA-binding XRE family transcriptional regulator
VQADPGTFATVLRRLRVRAGLTQEDLAERAGMSVRAVSALERGERRRPYPHTIGALAKALHLSDEDRVALQETVPGSSAKAQLPAPPTDLIGREDEVTAVVALLQSQVRLLTLVGPGGVGKTRLALACAAELSPRFRDGAALVSLAAISETALVPSAIGEALGLRESSAQPLAKVLLRYLRPRQLLLVIDNLEHVVGAAEHIAEILAAAPELTILATSRAPLRLRAEHLLQVPPLTLDASLDLIRVRAAQRSEGDPPAPDDLLRQICKRLDGLPLAIEMAAARMRVLSPQNLLDRLDDAISLLVRGPRDAPERHQTLRRTVAWSHDLLAPEAQILFRELAAFSGGWTLDAAVAVAGIEDIRTLDLLEELVETSLITCKQDAEPCFSMLETIRVFAAERLAMSGDEVAVRDRHAAHYRRNTSVSDDQAFGPTQPLWLDRMHKDHDNIRAALRWLLMRGEIEGVADICFSALMFWLIRGYLQDGENWADRGLAAQVPLSAPARAKLLVTRAAARMAQGRYDEAATDLGEGAVQARVAEEARVLLWALTMHAYVASYQCRPDIAAPILHEAGTLSREQENAYAPLMCLLARSHLAIAAGDLSAAGQLLARCVAESRAVQSPWTLGVSLNMHGRVLMDRGCTDDAASALCESTSILLDLEDTWSTMHALIHLSEAAARTSDPRTAVLLLGAAESLADRSGAVLFRAYGEPAERSAAHLESELGAQTFREVREQGRRLTTDEMMTLLNGWSFDT